MIYGWLSGSFPSLDSSYSPVPNTSLTLNQERFVAQMEESIAAALAGTTEQEHVPVHEKATYYKC